MIFSTLLLSKAVQDLENPGKFKFSNELDSDFLSNNYEGNLDLAYAIFEQFESSIEEEIAALRNHVMQLDFTGIENITHKIKNNFVYVGATNLSNLIKQIEVEAKEENASVVDTYQLFILESEKTLTLVSKQLEAIKEFLDKQT